LNSLDDPVITSKSINFEVFKNNAFVILGTTNYGGHLGFNESLFDLQVWYMKPALKYFNAYLD
jgi:predicted alpha/beta-fold hydrolase